MNIQEFKDLSLFKYELLENLEKLPYQGYCNINYQLSSNKNKYLVRVFKDESSVNISRDFEYFIQKKASMINIASKPLFMDKHRKYMITQYLNGIHKEKLNKRELIKLIETIKKLHNIKVKNKPYKIEKDLNNYKKTLQDKVSKKLIINTKKELYKIKKYDKYFVTTHHDLNPKNIIFYNSKIKFIDWEYAGVNSAFFDLATICVEFKIKKEQYRFILKKYFKKVKKEHRLLLSSYIKIYSNICELWFKTLK